MRRPIIVLSSLAALAVIADHAYGTKQPSPPPPPSSAQASASPRGDPRLRQAGHRGLSYLASASRAWTDQHQCFGCHVQAVTMCYRTGLMSGSWTGWLMVIAGLISWDPALEGWSGRST